MHASRSLLAESTWGVSPAISEMFEAGDLAEMDLRPMYQRLWRVFGQVFLMQPPFDEWWPPVLTTSAIGLFRSPTNHNKHHEPNFESLFPSPIVILSDSLVCTVKFIACNRAHTSKLINTSCYTLHCDLDLKWREDCCSTYTSRDGFNHYFAVHLARFEVFPICNDPSIFLRPSAAELQIRFRECHTVPRMDKSPENALNDHTSI